MYEGEVNGHGEKEQLPTEYQHEFEQGVLQCVDEPARRAELGCKTCSIEKVRNNKRSRKFGSTHFKVSSIGDRDKCDWSLGRVLYHMFGQKAETHPSN